MVTTRRGARNVANPAEGAREVGERKPKANSPAAAQPFSLKKYKMLLVGAVLLLFAAVLYAATSTLGKYEFTHGGRS